MAVSSCTTALHLALMAAGVKAGDEVLCPSLSFIATANAIVYAGAKPVFVDIDKSTYNIDPNCYRERDHSPDESDSGRPSDRAACLPGTRSTILRSRHDLAVIEDAACAIGAEYKGTPHWTALHVHGLFQLPSPQDSDDGRRRNDHDR